MFSPLFARPPDSTFSADSGSHFGAHLRGPFSEPEPAEAESSCGSAQQAPFPEPEKGFHFGSKISSNQGINFGRCESGVCANFDAKVTLFWRRADWLESKVPDGRVPMWVNLDETAVNYSYHSAKGLVSSLAWQKNPSCSCRSVIAAAPSPILLCYRTLCGCSSTCHRCWSATKGGLRGLCLLSSMLQSLTRMDLSPSEFLEHH